MGLICCSGQERETVVLLKLAKAGIGVWSYQAGGLPKPQLRRNLHKAVRLARG